MGKKLDATGLTQVWAQIRENFVNKGVLTNELIDKLQNMSENGQENVIESVSVNGVTCAVTNKGINIVIPDGTLADLDEVGTEQLSSALAALINGKADKATTLGGYGITDAYTKTQTDNAIKQAVTGVYKVKGSTAFANLPTQNMAAGDVYNITDAFTATDAFVAGESGKQYPAGTNVVYTDSGWDVMAGTYDFSDFMLKSELEDITEDEIRAICVL